MLRATFKSLLSRKLRLLLSGLAVILGVMAVSAAFILTNTLNSSFDSLFRTATQNIDVQVTGEETVSGRDGETRNEPIPEELVEQLKQDVPDAQGATGVVGVDGARMEGPDGKAVTTGGAPRLGENWTGESDLVSLAEGRAPKEPTEVVINKGLADKAEVKVGDTVRVATLEPFQDFTLVGIIEFSGGRASLGGETHIVFTTPTAQKLMLGREGVFSAIDLQAKDGVSEEELKKSVKSALGDQYVVLTGEEVADKQAQDVQEFLNIFRYILLGFAAIALFVGIFLILNTFTIIIAQRTKELALLRAMGASRKQVIGSVMLDALITGLVASTIGFFLGIGVAFGLKSLIESFGNSDLPGEGMKIPAIAVIASYLVGVVVTMVAVLIPAVKASRIPPVAAMQEIQDRPKPVMKMMIAGLIVLLAGIVCMALPLFGDAPLLLLALGVLLVFVGVAMVTPAISRPVVHAIGVVFTWFIPGKLGQRNSARNPRRTAITASALMIGVALMVGVTVVSDSFKASLKKVLDDDFGVELIIGPDFSDFSSGVDPSYDESIMDEIQKRSDIEAATGFWTGRGEDSEGEVSLEAAQVSQLKKMIDMSATSGEIRDLKQGEVLVLKDFADERDLSVGDTYSVTLRGGDLDLRVVGVIDAPLMEAPIISVADAKEVFEVKQPQFGYVQPTESADKSALESYVKDLLKENPEIYVQDKNDLIALQEQQLDQTLMMIYILLALAVVIAILGIINTLVLSILERTRELGLLRAVGLTRTQLMQMVTVESIVIAVFGALLGFVVGSALGTIVVKAIEQAEPMISELSLPWMTMVMFLIAAAVVGLFSAVLPAIRAARTNVLQAISYE